MAIVIVSGISPPYRAHNGFAHLSAGLACGAAQFASGIAVGVIGEAGTQGVGRQRALLAPTMLILIFTEALALYVLVVGMIASQGGVRKLDA